MFDPQTVFRILGLIVVGAPVALFCILGLWSLCSRRPLTERRIIHLVQTAIAAGLLASISILAMMLIKGDRRVPIDLGEWVAIKQFHFVFKFEFDRLSVPFVILTFVLCGTISAFCSRYLHREPGFSRFFFSYSLFLLGMVVTSLAGTIETLFTGWEFVGLSSALLIAFYHERSAPVRNGLRVWCVYRISDAALLVASLLLHHLKGMGDFDQIVQMGAWPLGETTLSPSQAFFVGLLLLLAAAGKSAMVPFSGWLPRAMEGPTPSSAVFYGALSVHLGAFLLLRFSPILDRSPGLRVAIVVVGLGTAVFGAFTGRVQTDIKCALSFASLTQVGLILAEIGMGWQYVALVHVMGHACWRTLQFLRAPTLLHDYHLIENAIGKRPTQPTWFGNPAAMSPSRVWLYRIAIERGHLDLMIDNWIVIPFVRFFQWCDATERRWTDFLSGGKSRESDEVDSSTGSLEEFL
jgi:NAD(P)H-quinone oxidoreductase subunit 5